jgi:hypothetical protein
VAEAAQAVAVRAGDGNKVRRGGKFISEMGNRVIMEEQRTDGQLPNNPAFFDYSKVMSEFPPILKNAHEIIDEVVRMQFRVRFICINSLWIIYLVICLILSRSLPNIIINMLLLFNIVFVIYVPWVLWNHYKTNWAYPKGQNEWLTNQYIKLYYWRAYFKSSQNDTFNVQAAVPNVMGDMIVFVKDINSILRERSDSVIMLIFMSAMLVADIFLNTDDLDSLLILLFIVLIAGVIIEIILLVKMKRSFSGLMKKLETYNRNVEEFWKRYW